MLEAKLTIVAPGLEAAINALAQALSGGVHPSVPTPAPAPAASANPTTAPSGVAAPMVTAAATTGPAVAAPPFEAPAPPVAGTVPTAPAMAPAPPVQPQPQSYAAPGIPLGQPPQYTRDQIMAAGATLMDAGKVNELMNLLHSFGVQAVMDLKPEQLGAFATAMRELGAKI